MASSPPGRSTLTTSAPMSPRSCAHIGPAMNRLRSRTRIPSRGPGPAVTGCRLRRSPSDRARTGRTGVSSRRARAITWYGLRLHRRVVRRPAASSASTKRRSGRRHDVDDRRPRPPDRAGPAGEQRRQVLAVGREQRDPRDASQADLPIDDEAANGIVLAPRPEPIAPERVLRESVVERRRRRGVPHHRAVVGRELEAALRPGLAQRQRLPGSAFEPGRPASRPSDPRTSYLYVLLFRVTSSPPVLEKPTPATHPRSVIIE